MTRHLFEKPPPWPVLTRNARNSGNPRSQVWTVHTGSKDEEWPRKRQDRDPPTIVGERPLKDLTFLVTKTSSLSSQDQRLRHDSPKLEEEIRYRVRGVVSGLPSLHRHKERTDNIPNVFRRVGCSYHTTISTRPLRERQKNRETRTTERPLCKGTSCLPS